jgi:hypothetical protein
LDASTGTPDAATGTPHDGGAVVADAATSSDGSLPSDAAVDAGDAGN